MNLFIRIDRDKFGKKGEMKLWRFTRSSSRREEDQLINGIARYQDRIGEGR